MSTTAITRKAIDLAERGSVPDAAIRWGMRRLVGSRLRAEHSMLDGRGRLTADISHYDAYRRGGDRIDPEKAGRFPDSKRFAEVINEFTDQVRKLVRLRRKLPLLRQARYIHGRMPTDRGWCDIDWLRPDGRPMAEHAPSNGWATASLARQALANRMRSKRRAQGCGSARRTTACAWRTRPPASVPHS